MFFILIMTRQVTTAASCCDSSDLNMDDTGHHGQYITLFLHIQRSYGCLMFNAFESIFQSLDNPVI